MAQLNEIYNQRILELSANIGRTARLPDPDASATAHSKICGSTISVDIKLDGGRVTDFGQTVKACLLGQASAAIMAQNIVGSEAGELRAVGAAMRQMLKSKGPPPGGRWSDLAVLEPVRDYKARHASTLLVFDAVEQALAEAEAKRANADARAGAPLHAAEGEPCAGH
jgi:NifU-like protein involved in Fe-S cluster formation